MMKQMYDDSRTSGLPVEWMAARLDDSYAASEASIDRRHDILISYRLNEPIIIDNQVVVHPRRRGGGARV